MYIYIYHISVAIWAQVIAFGLARSDTPVYVYELKSDAPDEDNK